MGIHSTSTYLDTVERMMICLKYQAEFGLTPELEK